MGIDNIDNLKPPGTETVKTGYKPPANRTDEELIDYLTSPDWRKYNEDVYVAVAAEATSRGLSWSEDLL